MDPLSILSVLLGTLIIAGRAPLVFAPAAVLRFNKKLLTTDARARSFVVVLAPLAVALIALPLGEGAVAGFLRVVGWVWAAAALWVLAFPGSFRRIMGGVLEYLETVDETVVRMIGGVAVAIGVALIYFGIYVA